MCDSLTQQFISSNTLIFKSQQHGSAHKMNLIQWPSCMRFKCFVENGGAVSPDSKPSYNPFDSINPLKTIWFCYNTHFPLTPARVYSGLVFSWLTFSPTQLKCLKWYISLTFLNLYPIWFHVLFLCCYLHCLCWSLYTKSLRFWKISAMCVKFFSCFSYSFQV